MLSNIAKYEAHNAQAALQEKMRAKVLRKLLKAGKGSYVGNKTLNALSKGGSIKPASILTIFDTFYKIGDPIPENKKPAYQDALRKRQAEYIHFNQFGQRLK